MIIFTREIWSSQDLFPPLQHFNYVKVFDEGQAELVSIWKLPLWRRRDTQLMNLEVIAPFSTGSDATDIITNLTS